jgi:hypothetical protein
MLGRSRTPRSTHLYETYSVPGSGAMIFQAATANLNPLTQAFKKQRRNDGVTEIVRVPDRGHALTIDSRWREVADTSLAFVKRFVYEDRDARRETTSRSAVPEARAKSRTSQ